jgi:hypothetical protein
MSCALPDRIFHLSPASNRNSILQHGLSSTTALLDLLGLHGRARACEHRLLPVAPSKDRMA